MGPTELQEKRIHLPRTVTAQLSDDWQHNNWQQELAESYTTVDELYHAELITLDEAKRLARISDTFQIRLPHYYASLIDRDTEAQNKRCPIRLQAIPDLLEVNPELPHWAKEWSRITFDRDTPWTTDPIGDLKKLKTSRLTHRYGNRALLHVSSMCALFCRFCFRKSHLNEKEEFLYNGSFELAYQYLKTHTEIEEVILTGGDPLSLTDYSLKKILDQLALIPHVQHVRIHTRMPVTLPSRMTVSLLDVLVDFENSSTKTLAIVTHFNHPKELTQSALRKIQPYLKAGIRIFNQSVLLKDVNDESTVLEDLFQTLYNNGVTPFYLHHPDWTEATFHFRRSLEAGREIYAELSGRISGPALPHYVLDLPGGNGKVLIMDQQRLKKINERHTSNLAGALYEVIPAHTKDFPQSYATRAKQYYADFFNVD